MKWCDLTFNHGGGIEAVTHHLFSTVTDGNDADDDQYKLVRAWDLNITSLFPWTHGVCHAVNIAYKEEQGTQVTLTIEHPHRFYAGRTPDLLTLATSRLSIRQCGCKKEELCADSM